MHRVIPRNWGQKRALEPSRANLPLPVHNHPDGRKAEIYFRTCKAGLHRVHGMPTHQAPSRGHGVALRNQAGAQDLQSAVLVYITKWTKKTKITTTSRHRNSRVPKVSMRPADTDSRRAVSVKGRKLNMEEGGAPSPRRALRSRAASALCHKVLSKIVTQRPSSWSTSMMLSCRVRFDECNSMMRYKKFCAMR
jgi:hypothetical protein